MKNWRCAATPSRTRWRVVGGRYGWKGGGLLHERVGPPYGLRRAVRWSSVRALVLPAMCYPYWPQFGVLFVRCLVSFTRTGLMRVIFFIFSCLVAGGGAVFFAFCCLP